MIYNKPACVFTAVLIIFINQYSFGQKSIVINTGFENSDTSIPGWIKIVDMKPEVTASKDVTTSYKGKNALHLQLNLKDQQGGYMQSQEIKVSNADRQIHVTAAVKTGPGTSADVYAQLFVKGKWTGEILLTPAYVQSDTWKTYFTRGLLPAVTDKIVLNLVVIDSGSAWFDNIEVAITTGQKAPPRKVKNVVDSTLNWAKNNYRFADSVNWKVIEQQMLFMARDARNNDDYYPSVRALVAGVKDPHGHILTAEQLKQGKEETVTNPDYKPVLPTAKLLDNGYAYLNVPRCYTSHPKLRKEYAEALLHKIRELDSMYILKGWLVDLRDNNGGFCDPMMAALSPVYGPGFMCGTVHFKKGQQGKRDSSFSIPQDGTYPFFTIDPYWPKRDLPIAVLSGPGTGSSGEIVLIGFKGHSRARIFGEPSAGVPTGPAHYVLPDGGKLALSESERFDRAGVRYGSYIYPDVIVLNPKNDRDFATDPVIAMAKKWLDKQIND